MALCDSVNLWLCDSLTLWTINGIITLPPFIRLGKTKFVSIWAKKNVLKFFSRPRGGWARARGQKNSDLSNFLSYFTRYMSKNLFGPYQLFAEKWPTIILHFKFKMIKKIWSDHIWRVCSHVFDQNGLPHGALITGDGNFFIKIYPPLNFGFVQENVIKSQTWSNVGRLADTPIFPKRPAL